MRLTRILYCFIFIFLAKKIHSKELLDNDNGKDKKNKLEMNPLLHSNQFDRCYNNDSPECQKMVTEESLPIVLSVIIPIIIIALILVGIFYMSYLKGKKESMDYNPDFDDYGDVTALPEIFTNKHYTDSLLGSDAYKTHRGTLTPNSGFQRSRYSIDPCFESFFLPSKEQLNSNLSLIDYKRQLNDNCNYNHLRLKNHAHVKSDLTVNFNRYPNMPTRNIISDTLNLNGHIDSENRFNLQSNNWNQDVQMKNLANAKTNNFRNIVSQSSVLQIPNDLILIQKPKKIQNSSINNSADEIFFQNKNFNQIPVQFNVNEKNPNIFNVNKHKLSQSFNYVQKPFQVNINEEKRNILTSNYNSKFQIPNNSQINKQQNTDESSTPPKLNENLSSINKTKFKQSIVSRLNDRNSLEVYNKHVQNLNNFK